jgi:ribose/xylose/arabinose/galactoside ABC-type transport system permease subunit
MASLTNMIQDAAQRAGNIKGGLVLLMPAYASVFVGISVLKKPTVAGTFLGALLIGLITNGFMLLGVKIYVITLITGIVLIVAIVISKTDFRQLARRFASRFAPAGEGQTP